MEGLSRLISKEKEEHRLEGIKISMVLRISHVLFVDDVLLFGKGTMEEWQVCKDILDIFSNASCMAISETQSIFMEFGM